MVSLASPTVAVEGLRRSLPPEPIACWNTPTVGIWLYKLGFPRAGLRNPKISDKWASSKHYHLRAVLAFCEPPIVPLPAEGDEHDNGIIDSNIVGIADP
jgi:hypothetical protein